MSRQCHRIYHMTDCMRYCLLRWLLLLLVLLQSGHAHTLARPLSVKLSTITNVEHDELLRLTVGWAALPRAGAAAAASTHFEHSFRLSLVALLHFYHTVVKLLHTPSVALIWRQLPNVKMSSEQNFASWEMHVVALPASYLSLCVWGSGSVCVCATETKAQVTGTQPQRSLLPSPHSAPRLVPCSTSQMPVWNSYRVSQLIPSA